MAWVWEPEKKAFVYNSGKEKYYCNKCNKKHYFDSKRGKNHEIYGEYPNFPFRRGKILIKKL